MPLPDLRTRRRVLALLLPALALAACARNPVTGRNELALISESQEIQMGQQGAQEVVQSMGLAGGEAMQQYVQAVGARLAATSERPGLPWTWICGAGHEAAADLRLPRRRARGES